MKTRFNTYDIVCGVTELQKLIGFRVNQIYDIDNKSFLFKLNGGGDAKAVLLIESGIRFHTTAFEWPKNVAPSGFSMKLRKHLKNKRLEKFEQLGLDRIVDFQFGTGEASYHIFLELYDRGNIVLTDNELTILYILRPHSDGEEIRFAVREKYPLSKLKLFNDMPEVKDLRENISKSSEEYLRSFLMSILNCGPALIDHVLTKYQLTNYALPKHATSENTDKNSTTVKANKRKRKDAIQVAISMFDIEKDMSRLTQAIEELYALIAKGKSGISKGYIFQRKEEKPPVDGNSQEYFLQNIEYHPYLFEQFKDQAMVEFESFMLAVDEFYSSLESQKIDLKSLQQEREAYKKLNNVKMDHAKRLDELNKSQEVDKHKADLISCNQQLVDNAILAVRSAIANQLSWPDINELVKAAQSRHDPVALSIKQLKLEINHIAMILKDPYNEENKDENIVVDIDLGLSAWANARKYYDQKRTAAQKEHKTISASEKALKSAERKTKETLKDVKIISTITKARKIYWFEKFYWFISSENYLVIGGRDAQQNELIVKRYMRPTDVYVHAEIQGASSVVIRNPGGEIPPKTLLEAGTMAISYSVAWDAKVITNAYWVNSNQVSKTAPSGEYLGTGSFMIRGKKNFLPSCPLVMGLSLLFKLENSFIEKHRGERKLKCIDEIKTELALDTSMNELSLIDEDPVNEAVANKAETLDKNQDNDKDSMESDTGEKPNFPDTEIKIEHDTGKVTIQNAESITKSIAPQQENLNNESEEATVISALPARKKQQIKTKKRKDDKDSKSKGSSEIGQKFDAETAGSKASNHLKRGQKSKMKKMKSKYKDQDEEERLLRMQILKSSGTDGAAVSNMPSAELEEQEVERRAAKSEFNKSQTLRKEVEVEDDVQLAVDEDILDSLTGQPNEDDELLFAVPVVAPYQALQNYKFKIKLIPGTGKRGRAAKTALEIFSKDKSCTPREKDLLKQIKDEAMARNIPGKVKIATSIPQKMRK